MPVLECIETGKGQQGPTAVLCLERHHGHLCLLIRSESANGFTQTRCCRHNRYQQSIATERGDCPEIGQWSGFGSRGGHLTACVSMRGPRVRRKLGG